MNLPRTLGFLILTAFILLTAGQAAAAKTVRVGVYNFAPLVFSEQGESMGLFIDVLRLVAAKEQWDLEFVFGSWAQCLARLDSGEIDILPSIAATPEREAKYDFTQEYLFLDWGLIYRRKGARIQSVLDLEGKRVAALDSSVYTKELLHLGSQFDIRFKVEPASEYSRVLAMVASGEADAGVCTNVYGTLLEDKYDVERTSIVFAPVKIRYAAQDGLYPHFLQPIDAMVAALKQDKDSAYYSLFDKWMGFSGKQKLPAWVPWTAAGVGVGLAVLGAFVIVLRRVVASRTAELKKALESLGESESRFRSTFEQTAMGMAHVGADGRWLLVNQKLCDIVGYTREELLTKTFQDITHPDDLAKDLSMLKELVAGKIPMYSLEKRYYRKDGESIWISLTVSMVRSDSGEADYFISAIKDITAKKAMEKELDKARGYIKNIINSMPSVVIGVDADGSITHLNTTAAGLLEKPGEDPVGSPLEETFPALAGQLDAIRRSIRERKPVLLEKEPHPANGEIHYRDVLIYPLVANGVEGAVLRVDDVTERVRLAEMMVQTEKMMSVGGLAAGMAHEINNPLGAILQSSQVALMHLDPGMEANVKAAGEVGCDIGRIRDYLEKRRVFEFLDGIRQSARRAAAIVANMLEFSRKSSSAKAPASMTELLDKSVELASSDYDLKKKYDFRHVAINRDYAPELSPVMCSRTEIEQVVLNLLKNAAQAMAGKKYPVGEGPAITLRARQAGEWVVASVEDNGPGMDEAVRKRVFEPFFTTKEPGHGTGLGLSVSYFIVTSNHGGAFSVESEPGRGARFTMELPAAHIGRRP
jgi:PAS domain S-box-containing protein